jgi:hypothetical protein
VLGAWLADREVKGPNPNQRRRAVAVDGKTLRGARRDGRHDLRRGRLPDPHRIRPQVMVTLRNLVVGVLCRAGPGNLAAALR